MFSSFEAQQGLPDAIVRKDDGGRFLRFRIDAIARDGANLIVVGWATAEQVQISRIRGTRTDAMPLTRHPRDDIAHVLAIPGDATPGFVAVIADDDAADTVDIEVGIPGCAAYRTGPVTPEADLAAAGHDLMPIMRGHALERLRGCTFGGDEWWRLVGGIGDEAAAPAGCAGFIEGVYLSPAGGGVVYGWALHPEDALPWLEDDERGVFPLSAAFRRRRADIAAAFGDVPWSDMDAAFIAYIPDLDGNRRLRLRCATADGVATLNERAGGEVLPDDPRRAAEKLFGIETEERQFHLRAPCLDWPVLGPLIERRQASVARAEAPTRSCGRPPDAPEVSIIVPLYKRYDFMEHQLLEFRRDRHFGERCELIYVGDDPEIEAGVQREADYLSALYGVAFRVVSGQRNRGFSGANNLGAAAARGRMLLFMNSDVIPIAPGWIERMQEAFSFGRVGAVGARLLFPDGGLQHAGMDFEFLDQFGIWSNQHPHMGLPPELDDPAMREVPAVTGACMMIPEEVFRRVGGWDTGYLIGDFEDSDLCFAVREAGYRVLYQPEAVLTHLERQSFTGVGADAFRLRMTICNAVRHRARWGAFLDAPRPTGAA